MRPLPPAVSRVLAALMALAVAVLLPAACATHMPPAQTAGSAAAPASSGGPLEITQSTDLEGPIPIYPEDARWGNASAPVTMVGVFDLQCPFCARIEGTL